ncbi:hypothetical protein S-PM2d007 [Synechococcus phage S-PM2]|uniref:Hypothetical-Protein / belonging to T4-LIKE GC: 753 n=1 Tax=Synechococcus phage S-PM2 TaxID=238854 RepID=Q5GQR3_BPSYP|nr:Hypothetical-Protein / belonging to T4-LIKE GC: 753 [Synechococcus phage S-PM2]CAF34071.1 Hypothetical-Protein / belonging to T4-LIKE GC: 753 [Synechococcus phage S-PM2]CFW42143.1 hypothetical protein S-PM2d007 [Synechococcus phage S-PM2]
MKKYLILVKKRSQIVLLILNIIIASANLVTVTESLDKNVPKMLLYCQSINHTTTICQEQ